MQLRILDGSVISLSPEKCASRFGKLPKVKLGTYLVETPGVLDAATVKEKLGKEHDRSGQPIRTFHVNNKLGWILFNYITKYEHEPLSYDVRDSLYSADIEVRRPRETRQKSRLLVVGFKPSKGKLCILSPRGEIQALEVRSLVNTITAQLSQHGTGFVDLRLQDDSLIDIANDCFSKGYDVNGARLTHLDLSLDLHCRGKSILMHPFVKSTEDEIGLEHKIRIGEWNSIAIEICVKPYSYIIYLSKARDIWDYLTIKPVMGQERMSLHKAAPMFESVISLVSLSLKPRAPITEQSSLPEFN